MGGNPVYQARSLYSLIDEEADFDDVALCIAVGYVVKSLEEQAVHVSVYPNPSRSVQLFFETRGLVDEDVLYMITLRVIQGRPVMQQTMSGQIGSLLVSSLAQGLYHWSLSVEGMALDQGKVAIY